MLFLSCSLFAQDITGLWKGFLYNDTTKKFLPYEIAVSENKGKLGGYSLTIFEENGKQEIGIRDITIKQKNDEIRIEDISLIDNSFTFVPPKNIRKTMILTLAVNDTAMILTGDWSTNRTKQYAPATGTVSLQRKIEYQSSTLFKRLDELKLADKLVFNEPQKMSSRDMSKIQNNTIENKNTVSKLPDGAPLNAGAFIVAGSSDGKVKDTIKTISNKNPSLPVAIADKAGKNNNTTAPKLISTAVVTKPDVVISTPEKQDAVKNIPLAPTAPVAPKALSTAVIAPVEKDVQAIKQAPQKMPVATSPAVVQGAADIDKRVVTTVQSVSYKSDSLVLTLYDNGYVDGDTVSVVMNGNIIFSKQGLSTKAVSKTIYINKETPDSIKLVMYAENLGSIPPNTGLLVVHDGEDVYDVRFSADLKSNAAIILTRKKRQ